MASSCSVLKTNGAFVAAVVIAAVIVVDAVVVVPVPVAVVVVVVPSNFCFNDRRSIGKRPCQEKGGSADLVVWQIDPPQMVRDVRNKYRY